jgi:hypothetical protein
MADSKLDTVVPKVAKLLLRILDNGSTDGERIFAIGILRDQLRDADSDHHDLVKRLAAEPFSQEEMRRIFNAGLEQGRAQELENAQRNAVIPAPFVAGDVGSGVGRYTWLQIAQHCERHLHCLDDWERGFIANVVRRLRYKAPTPKEAAKLHDIFHKRFGERMSRANGEFHRPARRAAALCQGSSMD